MKTQIKFLLIACLMGFSGFSFAKPPVVKYTNPSTIDKFDYYAIAQRSLSGFTAVNVGGPFDVVITQGPFESVKVEGPTDVMDRVITEVSNGELKVYNKNDGRDWENWYHSHKKIVVYVSLKDLKSIDISGSGDVFFKDGISANTLKLTISGAGSMFGTLNVKTLKSYISGYGDMKLKGKAENSSVRVVSSGDFAAAELLTVKSDVRVSGSGDAEVNASEKIDAKVNGPGDVLYTGTATKVSGSKTGSGEITRL
jgi:Putative auto-transporter adhesin, head GIN domain